MEVALALAIVGAIILVATVSGFLLTGAGLAAAFVLARAAIRWIEAGVDA